MLLLLLQLPSEDRACFSLILSSPIAKGQNYNYKGRERGRGSGLIQASRPVTKFTEEFDFSLMNEKFNKDEVWGTLGKSNRSSSKEKAKNATDENETEEENDSNLPKADVKVSPI